MAEKVSMLIVKVDLDCHKCYDKMRKILCKLQDHERIRTISFDDKSKTIAIAGPFDPQRLACKIRCRGGKTVKDIQIVDVVGGGGEGNPPPPSPAPGNNNGRRNKKEKLPPPATEQPPPAQPSSPPPEPSPPQERPPSPPPQPATPDRGMAQTMPAFHEEDRPMPPPAQLEPPPPPSPREKPQPPPVEYYMPPPAAGPPPPMMMKPRPPTPPPPCPTKPVPEPYPSECVIPTVEIPSWPAAPVGSRGCPCCAPCYQGYYEGCRCGCGGGRVYGCATAGPPPPAWCGYGPYGYRGCRIINEEDPSAACSIM